MAGGQIALRPGARHVLVSGHARRSRCPARRCRRGQGPPHRCGTLGRDGAAPALDRGRDRSRARPGHDRPGAGCDGDHGQFRSDRGQGARRGPDRRVLGERHGDRGRGAPRGRHGRPRRAPRRWAKALLQLYDVGAGDDRPADRKDARGRCRRGASDGQDPGRAEGRRDPRDRSRPQSCSRRPRPS